MSDPRAVLKAISDETRFAIITILLRHDVCAGAVARRLGVSEAAVSQHMKVLREAGLVTSEKRGYFTHYSVDREALSALSEVLADMASWDRSRCDPELEGCTVERRDRCPAEKCRGGCPHHDDGGRCMGCSLFRPDLERIR